jgi:hypothetical protein
MVSDETFSPPLNSYRIKRSQCAKSAKWARVFRIPYDLVRKKVTSGKPEHVFLLNSPQEIRYY